MNFENIFLFLMQYLSILQRNVYSSELLRHGWLDESAVVSDTELETLYNDLLHEQMRGEQSRT